MSFDIDGLSAEARDEYFRRLDELAGRSFDAGALLRYSHAFDLVSMLQADIADRGVIVPGARGNDWVKNPSVPGYINALALCQRLADAVPLYGAAEELSEGQQRFYAQFGL